jgi:hypothetical protein
MLEQNHTTYSSKLNGFPLTPNNIKIALKELLWSRITSVLGMGSADSPSTLCHNTMMQTKPSLKLTLAPTLTEYYHQGYGQLDGHL